MAPSVCASQTSFSAAASFFLQGAADQLLELVYDEAAPLPNSFEYVTTQRRFSGISQPHEHTSASYNHTWKLLGPVAHNICNLISIGQGDSMKRICLPNATHGQNTVLLSIGSNNQWSFEKQAVSFGFKDIFTFDCTLRAPPKIPKSIARRVTFLPFCISDANYSTVIHLGNKGQGRLAERSFVDWRGLVQATGIMGRPTILKMDVEGSEYATMRSLLNTPNELQPDQIALELHAWHHIQRERHASQTTRENNRNTSGLARFKAAGELMSFMQTMLFRGGYVLTDVRDMSWARCAYCAELLLVKRCR